MTVYEQGNKIQQTADGLTTLFSYPYPFIDPSEIVVFQDDVKVTEGYNVEFRESYENGSNIIFNNPPLNGANIIITREIPSTQEISYPENDPFPSKVTEEAFDKLTLSMIDLKKSTIKVPLETPPGFNPVMPKPVANKGIKYDETGNQLVTTEFDPDQALVITEDFKNVAAASAQAAKQSETNAKASEANSLQNKNDAALSASLAKDWATKMDGKVEDIDYSSKYYANNANELNTILTDNYNQYKVDLENEKNNGLDALANASNALRQTQLTNCILEAPNGVATYEGSVITIKQGLRFLTANGRNSDKTLINLETTLENDVGATFSGGYSSYLFYIIKVENEEDWAFGWVDIATQWFEQTTQPAGDRWNWYNTETGEWKYCVLGTIYNANILPVGTFNYSASGITDFKVFNPVELLKRSNKAEITSWGFPSGEYEDWTLGASGQIYTAPCDGTLVFAKYGLRVGEYIQFNATEADLTSKNMMLVGNESVNTFCILYCHMNMLKGQQTKIYYNATGDIMAFRFIYAKGAK